jgi:hypothetical protein
MKKVFSVLAIVTAVGFTASAAAPQSNLTRKHAIATTDAKEPASVKKHEAKLTHKKHRVRHKSSHKATAVTPAQATN